MRLPLPRWLHRTYAWTLNYFWIPCPLCGRHFGGHEWLDSTPEHPATIRKPNGGGTAICPQCTRDGRGERVNIILDADWDRYEAAMRHAADESNAGQPPLADQGGPMTETIEVEKIQRLDIKPGEILVVKLPQGLGGEQLRGIRESILERMPEGVELLLTSGDIDFSVVSRTVPQTVPPPPPIHDDPSLGEYFGNEPQ